MGLLKDALKVAEGLVTDVVEAPGEILESAGNIVESVGRGAGNVLDQGLRIPEKALDGVEHILDGAARGLERIFGESDEDYAARVEAAKREANKTK